MENSSKVTSFMSGTPKIIYQNGEDAGNFATFSTEPYTINIQTDSDDDVGVKRTIIRSCDNLNRLLEMNLYIEVLANTYPDFTSEPETSFAMPLNDVIEY